jgi:hypothetical protein
LVRKPEEKRQFGKLRRRWDDKIIIDFREIVWEGVDWIHLAQVLVNTVMIPWSSETREVR